MDITPDLCKHGHDKNVVGVLKSGFCRECGRIARRSQWANATDEQKAHIRQLMRTRYKAGLSQTNITIPVCPKGHVKADVGVLKNGACRLCTREQEHERRQHYTPEQREKRRIAQRTRYTRSGYEDRRDEGLKLYGIDQTTYIKMSAAQKGLCAICMQPETRMRDNKVQPLHVDHDHKTNKLRKLLCSRCNVAIGYLHDDPLLCIAAAEYLWSFAQITDFLPNPDQPTPSQ